MAGKPGERPWMWKYKDPEVRKKYTPFLRARAQASFRSEDWSLTFEDWLELWTDSAWALRGKATNDLCLSRINVDLGWHKNNVDLITRADMVRRQRSKDKGSKNV